MDKRFAVLGAPPAFTQPLHVAQLNLPPWEMLEQQFRGIFARRWFTNKGPLIAQLDAAVASALDVKHAVCVANGTLALMLMIKSLEVRGEVLVPAFTFPATAQAVSWAGLKPVLCDVDPRTHMLTAATAAPRITAATGAILGVHAWGQIADTEGLQVLAQQHGLALCFDACHAFGCRRQGVAVAAMGAAAAFSFHATKIVNAAEGGCITTDDDQLADRLRAMRSFYTSETDPAVPLRLNAKMSEAQAALALLSLADLPANIAANRTRHQRYLQGLAGVPGLRLLDIAPHDDGNYQYVVVEVDAAAAGIGRDTLFSLLQSENVFCRRHFHPGLHRMPPYSGQAPAEGWALPATEHLCDSLLQFPSGQAVSLDDTDRICELVRRIVANADSLAPLAPPLP